jgi:hypothetical protein
MAIIGSVFALLGRFAGRLINALLGWATLLLFGRVEARKQTILGFLALASLAWVAAGGRDPSPRRRDLPRGGRAPSGLRR